MKAAIFLLFGCFIAFPKDFSLEGQEGPAAFSARSKQMASERAEFQRDYLARLQLPPGRDSCVAYDSHSGNCLIHLTDFNNALGSYVPDSIVNLADSSVLTQIGKTRNRVLRTLLESAYLDELQSGMAPNPEVQTSRAGGIGKSPGWNRKRITFVFGIFPDLRIQAFASSDSDWLANRLYDPREKLRPANVSYRDLPDSILLEAADLEARNWTGIRKTAYGCLTVSLSENVPLGLAMNYVDSQWNHFQPQGGSALQKAVDSAMHAERSACISRDTFGISLQLIPESGHSLSQGKSNPDWMRTVSTELPGSIAMVLPSDSIQPGDTLGPFQSRFGKLQIAFLDRKPGAAIPLNVCRDSLKSRILARDRLEFLKSGFAAVRLKSKKPPGTIYGEWVRRQELAGDRDPDRTYQRLRDDWILKSVRLNLTE